MDENCVPVGNNNDENQNTAIPEQEICGDLIDNDGNGLADEKCVRLIIPRTLTVQLHPYLTTAEIQIHLMKQKLINLE